MEKLTVIFFVLFFSNLKIFAQDISNEHFTATAEDEKRWQEYSDFIYSEKMPATEMADSIYRFALTEYLNKQFFKCRELCELMIQYDPTSAKPHILIGQAYASSSNICKTENRTIKEGILWAAIDEWEMAIAKGDEDGKATLLIERYSAYLPLKEDFKSCTGRGRNSNLDEGDEYFVKCWINKQTTIRLKKE